MDRFLIQLALGYPEREEERLILHRFRADNPLSRVKAIVEADEIRQAVTICRDVFVHPVLEDYLLDLVQATREDGALDLGVSPRGSLAFYRTIQALAAIQGRTYVTPDDIQQLAPPVLRHRLIPGPDTRLHGTSVAKVLDGIIRSVPVPVEENWDEGPAQTESPEPLGAFGTDLEQELEAAVSPEATVNGPAADERSSLSS